MIQSIVLYFFFITGLFGGVLEPSILRHDFVLYKELECFTPPYVVIYKNKLKELRFVAAFHGAGIQSPTFQMIRKTIGLFQPEVVIIEGIPSSLGLDSPLFIEIAQTHFSQNFQQSGEAIYSIYLAHYNHFSFIGGEPDHSVIFKKCIELGYSSEDVLGFYLIRQVPQWRREGKLSQPFERLAEELIKIYQKQLKLPQYTTNSFYTWHLEKFKCFFDIEKINEETTMPLKLGTFLQIISWEINIIRDKHLQKIIEQNINQFDRVLVVYGRAHHIIHRAALEQYFGRGEFVK